MNALLQQTVSRLRQARSVLVLTGAGMSADSGLPTYRGQGGLYAAGQGLQGYPIEECLSASMLRRRPDICWMALHQLLDAAGQPQPHAGHKALAEMEQMLRCVTVITQNVDGLHQAAGSIHVVEMHGHIQGLHCERCSVEPIRAENADWRESRDVPLCASCAGVLRPPVVLFEEALPDAALRAYEECLRAQPDVVVLIGTSAGFTYIQAPVWQVRSSGGWTVDINPAQSAVSHIADWHWQTTAAQSLPELRQALASARAGGSEVG